MSKSKDICNYNMEAVRHNRRAARWHYAVVVRKGAGREVNCGRLSPYVPSHCDSQSDVSSDAICVPLVTSHRSTIGMLSPSMLTAR